MSVSSTALAPLAGLGLRAIVVTLDQGRNAAQPDAPASMLRALGHDVLVSGYDLNEVEARPLSADVVLVEAGDHLEIGRSVIARLRERPELIAARILLGLEVTRIVAYTAEVGADDFILLPTTLAELTARLWQLKARDNRPRAPLQLRYGEITLDCEMRQAYRDGDSLNLTSYEFQLLRFLAERVDRVFSRQELLVRVWGYRHTGSGRNVDNHTLNLRKKLGDLGERLETVIGVGYKLRRVDPAIDRIPAGAEVTPLVHPSTGRAPPRGSRARGEWNVPILRESASLNSR